MELVLAGILIVVGASFIVALVRLALQGVWWVICLPFRALRALLRASPPPASTQGCEVYRFPGRT